MSIVPPMDSEGTFVVKEPFSLAEGVSYKCIAQREFADILIGGTNVFDRYYSPYGISEDKYKQDLADNVYLITLSSESNGIVYIPSSYIVSYPVQSVVTFRHRVASVSLGAFPDTVPLDDFVDKLAALASDVVGVVPTVTMHTVDLSSVVSKEAANAFEAARQARITDRTTEHAQLIAAKAENQELRTRIALLEELLVNAQA